MNEPLPASPPNRSLAVAARPPRETPLDLWPLRWLITLIPFAAAGLFIYDNNYMTYAWMAGAIFGGVLSLYFGHILLFRLQCGLFELMAMTIVLGLFEGLMLSTPGLTRIALWLSPLVLAWILYGAVVGLSRARLLEVTGTLATVAHLFAAWLGIAWMALAGLGAAMLSLGDGSNLVSAEMRRWCWPLLILAAAGLVLDIVIGIKMAKRAREVLRDKSIVAGKLGTM